MRDFLNRVIIFGLIFGSMTAVALGKPLRKKITFTEPVKVNGVLVKPGSYQVEFDDETRELTISKGKRVIAKAPAQLEILNKDSQFMYELLGDDVSSKEPKLLTRVGLKDRIQAKLLNAADVKAEGVR